MAGLRQGDHIVAIEGKPVRMTPKQFNLHVKLNYKPGDKLPVTLLRNGKQVEFKWPLK